MGQWGVQAAAVDGECKQAKTEAKEAHTVALENKVNMATVEIQNMKSSMHTMAEAMQAMYNMMMSNASSSLVAPESVAGERPRKWSQ